jgi:predicted nucleotidyltransferase
MMLSSYLKENQENFLALCKEHKVRKMFGFGSAITDHFDPDKSDVDILVELDIEDPLEYGESLLSLWDNLEIYFKRKVDLLTDNSIRNPILRKSIEETKVLIYDGQGEKVFV